MEFKIRIITGIPNQTPTDNFNPGRGFDIIQMVRDECKIPDLPVHKIRHDDSCDWSDSNRFKVDSQLTCGQLGMISLPGEDLVINEIEQFSTNSNIQVYVRPGFLGQYYKVDYDIEYVGYFDSDIFEMFKHWWFRVSHFFMEKNINRVQVKYKFDFKTFLKDWVNDGAPEYYGTTKDKVDIAVKEHYDKIKLENEKSARIKEENRLEEESRTRDENRVMLTQFYEDMIVMTNRLGKLSKRITDKK